MHIFQHDFPSTSSRFSNLSRYITITSVRSLFIARNRVKCLFLTFYMTSLTLSPLVFVIIVLVSFRQSVAIIVVRPTVHIFIPALTNESMEKVPSLDDAPHLQFSIQIKYLYYFYCNKIYSFRFLSNFLLNYLTNKARLFINQKNNLTQVTIFSLHNYKTWHDQINI